MMASYGSTRLSCYATSSQEEKSILKSKNALEILEEDDFEMMMDWNK